MAFTGDLEHLPIVDIIQLVHSTRKSGIFAVKGDQGGESKIVFSKGSVVGANHINDSVRIGTVLVKTGAITIEDLKQAIDIMKSAGKDRMPLLVTLIRMGKLKREDALRGLKKLVELTIIDLMTWTKGTFTFDADAVVVSSEEQDLGVDAQMVLMEALRISDERERDRASGKTVPSFESMYADVLPEIEAGEEKGPSSMVTAEDLGLADLDRLEKKIRRPVSGMEAFDPVEIHRKKIEELLPGFSPVEQEAFAFFLRKPAHRKPAGESAAKQAGKAVVIFSNDAVISHSVVSLCNGEGILALATDNLKDLDRMVAECLLSARMPVIVFDDPSESAGGFSREEITAVRNQLKMKYTSVPLLQFASPEDSDFMLESYHEGVRAVLPKPSKEDRKQTYIPNTIKFLKTFKSYITAFQYGHDDADSFGKKLKDGIISLRTLTNHSDAPLVVLAAVSEIFERAITLFVRASELIGERAIGLSSDKSMGPAAADGLRIQLSKPSVFRDVVEKGRIYYGESGDETLRAFFIEIGRPLSPAIVLLPLICDRRVVAVIYGDFGQKGPVPVRLDMLEILSQQAGIVLESAIFRRQVAKAAKKS